MSLLSSTYPSFFKCEIRYGLHGQRGGTDDGCHQDIIFYQVRHIIVSTRVTSTW